MKLKAETLIETIVASVILTLTLMLALSIINNVVLTKNPSIRMKIQDAIDNQLFTIVQNNQFETKTIELKDFTLKQTVESYDNELKLIRIEVFKKDSIFVTGTKRLIYCGRKNTSIYSY